MQTRSPIRKCIGCGGRKSEFEMIRIVNNNEQVFIDPDGNLPGRSAHICASARCIEKARENNEFSRTLKVSNPDKVYSLLMEEIGNDIENS